MVALCAAVIFLHGCPAAAAGEKEIPVSKKEDISQLVAYVTQGVGRRPYSWHTTNKHSSQTNKEGKVSSKYQLTKEVGIEVSGVQGLLTVCVVTVSENRGTPEVVSLHFRWEEPVGDKGDVIIEIVDLQGDGKADFMMEGQYRESSGAVQEQFNLRVRQALAFFRS